MDVGQGCLLLDCAGRRADCDVVGPGSIASLLSEALQLGATETPSDCEASISRFLSWRSPRSRIVAASDRHSINSTFVC